MSEEGKIFAISDTHCSHWNIIRYCDRPFKTTEEMNDVIIKNWNNTVGDNDTVIFGGDFYLPRIKPQHEDTIKFLYNSLRGNKIFLRGNHDVGNDFIPFHPEDHYILKYKDSTLYFTHKPPFDALALKEWQGGHPGMIFCCGHIHNKKFEYKPINLFNISVEMINYTPILLDEIIKQVQFKKYQPWQEVNSHD